MLCTSQLQSFFPGSASVVAGLNILFRHEKTQKPFCIAILNLTELETTLSSVAAAYLSSEEQELFTNYTYAKRRREWLGGRITAKHAICALQGFSPVKDNLADLVILPRENGSPVVSSVALQETPHPRISISHSSNYAVAMAVTGRNCGIDIQQVSEKTERVQDRFCEPDETKLLEKGAHQLDKKEQLTLLWAAKEALKKSLLIDQPTIFKGVTLQALTTDHLFSLELSLPGPDSSSAKVKALQLDDYMLAYTIAEKKNA